MNNRRETLLRQKQFWQRKKLILNTILQSIIHNAISCPNGTGKRFDQCRTSMAGQSHLSGRGPAHRKCSARFFINDRRADRTCQKTHTSLRQYDSATRKNCSQDRETSVLHNSAVGYRLSQRQTTGTFGETHLQPGAPDNCQNLQAFPTSANSSSGSVRRYCLVPKDSVKTLQQAVALYNCQNLNVFPSTPNTFSGSEKRIFAVPVAVPDYSSQISHTQRGVLSYLPRTTSSSRINHIQQNELNCLHGSSSSQIIHTQENALSYTQSASFSQFNHSKDNVYTRDTSSSHFNHTQESVWNHGRGTSSSQFNLTQEDVLNSTHGTSSSQLNHTQEDVLNYNHETSSSQLNHTQQDVLNFLSDTSDKCPNFPSNLNDIQDIISRDCQPLNSQPQSQDSFHTATGVYPLGGSSSQSEISHSRSTDRNRRNKRVIKHQSCIKPHASKCNTNINVNAEDDDVEKSQTKSEVKTGNTVTVMQQMVARLTIDDTGT